MVEDLTGLAVAGASLLDEATAAAEAMTLTRRAARTGSVFLADSRCLPQTLAVLATRAAPLGIDLVVAEVTEQEVAAQPAGELFGVLLPYPDATGEVRDLRPAIAAARERGALVAVAADLLALTLLMPLANSVPTSRWAAPSGSVSRWGTAARTPPTSRSVTAWRASCPGGSSGCPWTPAGSLLPARAAGQGAAHPPGKGDKQHLAPRRCCLAVIAGMYGVYHGPDGLTAIAGGVHRKAAVLAASLRAAGCAVAHENFFDTVAVTGIPGDAAAGVARARRLGYNLYLAGPDTVQAACDETTTDQHLRYVVAALADMDPAGVSLAGSGDALADGLRRTTGFLAHPVFHEHHKRDLAAAVPAAAGRLRPCA